MTTLPERLLALAAKHGLMYDDLTTIEEAAQSLQAAPEVGAWRPIDELPDSDDLFWFIRWDGRSWVEDGPRAPQIGGYDADEWDWFTPAESPPKTLTQQQGGEQAARDVEGDSIEKIVGEMDLYSDDDPHAGKLHRMTRHWMQRLDTLRSKQAAGEAVAPDLSDDGIGRIADDVYRAMRENGYTGAQGGVWWNKSMYAAGWNAGYRATPPRHPAEEGIARDALRYRWLREGDNDEIVLRYIGGTPVPVMSDENPPEIYLLRNELLDAAIDAALAGSP